MAQKQYTASVYRLNISYLKQSVFGVFPVLGKNTLREPNLSPGLEALKTRVLERLWVHEKHRGLTHYKIAWETHQSSGLAHLDILIVYERGIKKRPSSFNYLLEECPQDVDCFSERQGRVPQLNLTPYSATRMNQAILEYGEKEDPSVLTNFTYEMSDRFLILAAIRGDPFGYLHDIMVKDPYNFHLANYAEKYDLFKEIPNWGAIKTKLNDSQGARRALTEEAKPGIVPITEELIRSRLSSEELETFYKYPCFQTIVDHINQIPQYGYNRPHKTLNLFIYGPRGVGKTSLLNEGPVNLKELVPCYDINLQNKYLNVYFNRTYGFISWNEFKYTDFSPTWILKLLEGLDLEIPIRYNSNIKRDNPLVIATSNLSLTEHIERRFRDEPRLIEMAKSNLLGERIVEVYVPVPMFFMQKLLVSRSPLPL